MDRYYQQQNHRFGSKQPQDIANWGYIILYLFVIVGSLIGNGLFLFTIKKNPNMRRSHHFLLSSLAIRDLIVTILVIPFAMDSQVIIWLCNWYVYRYIYKFLDIDYNPQGYKCCICFKPGHIWLKGNVIIFSGKNRTENYVSTFYWFT